MPLKSSHKITIIIFIALLVVSATVLRFIPAESSKPLNSASLPDQLNGPLELTDKSIASVLNNSSLFVLDFYYPGCGPCNTMNNTTAELSNELLGQVLFGSMNVRNEENSKTVKDYKISAYPTLLIFDEGVLVNRMRGNTSKSDLLAELKSIDPDLDDSKVKLQPSRQAAAKSEVTPESAAEQPRGKVIPLIKLGTKDPSGVMQVTDDTIDTAISQYQPLLVVVGFTNPCPFCELFNVTVSELAIGLRGQAAFGMIDTRLNKQTREKYNITGIPATLIFKDGEFAGKVQGNKDKAIIVAKLKEIEPKLNISKVVPPPPPKLTPEQVCANMTKSDLPLLQAFVVSKCPFGLQMQRIMADTIIESEKTEEYLKVMYIGSVDADNNTITAMHGNVEAQENLRQICIREEQPDRYWDYLRCYMREGKTADCLISASVDVDELDSCTNDSARGLVYAQEDFDMANKFRITGSPTMVMNDEIVKEHNFATDTTNARSPQALKELLCCGFNEKPSFCSQELNKSRAATMFSVT